MHKLVLLAIGVCPLASVGLLSLFKGGAMAEKKDATYDRLIKVGLQDPFIRGIAGVVVIATAASIAISTLGSGTKAIITIALSLLFGVVLVVLRALMKYADSTFVRIICFGSSAVIMTVFLVFTVLLVPAAVVCWPQPYAHLLSLPNCELAAIENVTSEKPFTPVAYTGTGITHNPDNNKYLVLVFYRVDRKQDAERIVGALQTAGYRSDAIQSSLDEVLAPDKRPGTTLIKTTALARPIVADVSTVVRYAIPAKASYMSLFPDDAPLRQGNIQISLF
jgi:hypothetical protein